MNSTPSKAWHATAPLQKRSSQPLSSRIIKKHGMIKSMPSQKCLQCCKCSRASPSSPLSRWWPGSLPGDFESTSESSPVGPIDPSTGGALSSWGGRLSWWLWWLWWCAEEIPTEVLPIGKNSVGISSGFLSSSSSCRGCWFYRLWDTLWWQCWWWWWS